MSKPRDDWWDYAKRMIRKYPALKRDFEDLHSPSITANTTGVPGSGAAPRATENAALRSLPQPYQSWYDAITGAIWITQRYPNGSLRLAVVDLVLWRQTHTIAGAAQRLHCSERSAKEYHRDFIRLAGELFWGAMFAPQSQKDVL